MRAGPPFAPTIYPGLRYESEAMLLSSYAPALNVGPGGGLLSLLLAVLAGSVLVSFSSGASAAATAAAADLIAKTPASRVGELLQPFSDEARSDWHYTPRQRSGVAWKDMNAEQRAATLALLRTALSAGGLDKVRAIMALEIALRELGTLGSLRDPENYALAIFGRPGADAAWGYRLEGHHLSLHFTLVGDRYVATLPQFFGANPARVPRDIEGGPKQGSRVLAREEDLARRLMQMLDAEQRAAALFDTRTYGDIVTRNARALSPLDPVGIAFGRLSPAAQATLLELITAFAEHLRPELAEARLTRVRAGGLETIRFGWAGSLVPGEPHYYRIQGKAFLIELDNSGGNHIHSVWRDFLGDFGRDVLREHYQRAQGSSHHHGRPR